MNSLIKGALIGGVVGGGIARLQAARQSDAASGAKPPALPSVAEGVVEGLVAGTFVGFVLDRRARSQARALAIELTDEGLARGRRFAHEARPVLESAYDTVADQIQDASQLMATAFVPTIVAAAGRAAEVVEAARPSFESAVDAARARAASLAA